MPVVTIETVGSRAANMSVDNPSVELMFTSAGSFNDAEIMAAIEAQLPPIWTVTSAFFGTMNLVIQNYQVRQRQEGNWIYDGSAMYGRTQPRKTGQVWFSFDGTGGTAHVQTSERTIEKYARTPVPPLAAEVPPDFKQAIGVSNDTVEGCDKIVPQFKFRLDYYPAVALMTAEYIRKLYLLTGRTNLQEVSFGGLVFDPGELLYLGPTGQPRGFDDWEIGLHFFASPNRDDIKVGAIEDIIKRGHDYLWFRFMDAEDQSIGIKIPQFGYVEEIQTEGNFSDLGIDGIPIQGLAEL